mgnify:FL=1
MFQYSSYHSVSEVTQPNYEGCNTTNVLQTSSNGNTSIPLKNPGDRYFVCGNRLHCLGGMKLHVHVQDDRAPSPASAPEAEAGGSLPPGSTKNNNPPSSAIFNRVGKVDLLFHGILGLVLCIICCGVVWILNNFASWWELVEGSFLFSLDSFFFLERQFLVGESLNRGICRDSDDSNKTGVIHRKQFSQLIIKQNAKMHPSTRKGHKQLRISI